MGGIAVNPTFMDELEREGIQIQAAAATLLMAGYEICIRKDAQVVHHRHSAHVEIGGEFAHGEAGAVAQVIEDRAAGFMDQSLKNRIHVIISKHVIILLHIEHVSLPVKGQKAWAL
jgi:hypothetical protein